MPSPDTGYIRRWHFCSFSPSDSIQQHLNQNHLSPSHLSKHTQGNNMKASVVAFTALLGLASAQNAVVMNTCPTAIYVQSFPYDGSAAGPLTTVQPGKSFSEAFRASGSVCLSRQSKSHDSATNSSRPCREKCRLNDANHVCRLSRLPRPRRLTSLCSLGIHSPQTPTTRTVSFHWDWMPLFENLSDLVF